MRVITFIVIGIVFAVILFAIVAIIYLFVRGAWRDYKLGVSLRKTSGSEHAAWQHLERLGDKVAAERMNAYSAVIDRSRTQSFSIGRAPDEKSPI